MKINDVCLITGLTKKAISYYENNELIKPSKDSSGYRDYTNEDIIILNEVALYRKLDISIKEIKLIINSNDKRVILNKIIVDKRKKELQMKMQNIYLDRIIESGFGENEISALNKEIINEEKNSGEFIKKELKRAFPSGLGLYLSNHFSAYLNEPIDTLERCNAWTEIVEFLDNVPDIKIPKLIEKYYENISEEMAEEVNKSTRAQINRMLNAEGEELEEYKKEILHIIEKQNDKSILKIMNPLFKFKKKINEFFNSSGYYDIFIPNMKVLSKEYKEYHEKLIKLNERVEKELGIKYDENMRIVRVKI